jgi:hypothetical protein
VDGNNVAWDRFGMCCLLEIQEELVIVSRPLAMYEGCLAVQLWSSREIPRMECQPRSLWHIHVVLVIFLLAPRPH